MIRTKHQEELKEPDLFVVKELSHIAFLILHDIPIKKVARPPDQKFTYIYFSGKEQCEKLINGFIDRSIKVAPADFYNALLRARDLVFSVSAKNLMGASQ